MNGLQFRNAEFLHFRRQHPLFTESNDGGVDGGVVGVVVDVVDVVDVVVFKDKTKMNIYIRTTLKV